MATLLVAIFCAWFILQKWNSSRRNADERSGEGAAPSETSAPSVQSEPAAPTSGEISQSPEPESASSEAPTKSTSPSFAEKIKNSQIISNDEYRHQVQSNPHGTPPALINSALQLGQLFDAVKNESEASQFMSHLKNCLNADTPPSFKSTCYKYADQISLKYASLRGEFNGLKLDEDTQKIIDMKKQGF